jgi:hypothetical protein
VKWLIVASTQLQAQNHEETMGSSEANLFCSQFLAECLIHCCLLRDGILKKNEEEEGMDVESSSWINWQENATLGIPA